ncbi:MAG: type II toxin-antitoxin system RelB/DinJ family antitoxin [Oscillospiraceae bacterium]|nr:type II toxin-antitoxin system RelB/DinJ family antitoxin [Oscillospiraceae bacterium]MCR5805517.1 type II toxin-antitoxin system RelB/DinJ family antitoxin [Oscillospiraceae bacterium]
MANLQVRLNDDMKARADQLFASLGFDTSTAVRMFLAASIENNGLPFEVRHRNVSEGLKQAIYDTRNRTNLSKAYDTAEEAVAAMLED